MKLPAEIAREGVVLCAEKITSIWLGVQPEIGNDDIVKVDRFKAGSVSKAWETKNPLPQLIRAKCSFDIKKGSLFLGV